MINNASLVGRLTEIPKLRQTNSGIGVTNFTVAVERNFTNAQGERESDFIRCIAWRKTAEIINKFAYKGSLVGIVGAIETGSYENSQGQKVYTTEINVDNFQMLEPKSVTDNRRNQAIGGQNSNSYNNKQFNQSKKADNNPFADIDFDSENPFESNDDVADISDDDLPF